MYNKTLNNSHNNNTIIIIIVIITKPRTTETQITTSVA